jgi:two-component system, NtrC family, sensor kinase
MTPREANADLLAEITELRDRVASLTRENAELQGALARASHREGATGEILRVISQSPTDVQPVFDAIVENAARLCDGVFSTLISFDGELMRLEAAHNWTPEAFDHLARRILPAPPSRVLPAGRAILDCTVIHLPDIELDQEFGHQELTRAVGFRSILTVPMLRDGVPLGAISVARAEPGAFSDNRIALLKTFAAQAVIAIENVRLFKELGARNVALTESLAQQTATGDILRAISGSPVDVQPVFEAIARNAVQLCGGVLGAVFRFDGEFMHVGALRGYSADGEEATRRAFPTRPERRMLAGRAVLSRATVHVPDVLADPEFDYRALAATADWRSLLVIPMLRGGEVLGTVGVTRAQVGPFRDQEIGLLQTFADQAVIAIENVRLFKELQTSNRDLTTALDTQTATSDILRVISRSQTDVQPVFDAIVASAVRLLGAYSGTLTRIAGEQIELAAITSTSDVGDAALRARFPQPLSSAGPHARTIRDRVPLNIADAHTDPRLPEAVHAYARVRGYRSQVAVPLLRHDEAIGTISLTRGEPGGFTVDEIGLLQTFADQAVIAIENVRLFNELAAANRDLKAASQHKSEFLANMSHELRTPLNAVIGFSEVLTDRMFGELNEKQEEYLKDIYASGTHLLSLINDILDLSKIEAGRMELELTDFDLPQAIDNALTLVRERAGRRNITLQMSVDERLGEVRADERKIRQVVLNLLSNAIKFTLEGGRIEVAAMPRDGSVEISVSDTGIGIAPEDQEKVFEEFRQVGTADKKAEGTGLGLTLCRKFIELHGGRIWVTSQVGTGSTFTFTIPVRHGE